MTCICGKKGMGRKFFCDQCWKCVPKDLQDLVDSLYNDERTRNSDAHISAIAECIKHIRKNQPK